jgi:hypothetical protein
VFEVRLHEPRDGAVVLDYQNSRIGPHASPPRPFYRSRFEGDII